MQLIAFIKDFWDGDGDGDENEEEEEDGDKEEEEEEQEEEQGWRKLCTDALSGGTALTVDDVIRSDGGFMMSDIYAKYPYI